MSVVEISTTKGRLVGVLRSECENAVEANSLLRARLVCSRLDTSCLPAASSAVSASAHRVPVLGFPTVVGFQFFKLERTSRRSRTNMKDGMDPGVGRT